MRLLSNSTPCASDFDDPELSVYALAQPEPNEQEEVIELATIYSVKSLSPSKRNALVVPEKAFQSVGVTPVPDNISTVDHPLMHSKHHMVPMTTEKAEQLVEAVKDSVLYEIPGSKIKDKSKQLYQNDPDFKRLMDEKEPHQRKKFGIS